MSLEEQIRLIDDTIARIMSLTMRAVIEATNTIKPEDAFDRVNFLMKENIRLQVLLRKHSRMPLATSTKVIFAFRHFWQ